MSTSNEVHVLILNQHGDNRGDEAALRAMLFGIEAEAPGRVRFTVLHQFTSKPAAISVPQTVQWISLVPTPFEAVRICVFALFIAIGFRWTGVLGPWGRSVSQAFTQAHVAVSAPGGPYFGDPYAGHEVAHWFYVWLAARYSLPLMLYAPSVGPFEKFWLNHVRRRLFRRFDAITVREDISLSHLNQLLGERGPIPKLAMDSALQRPLAPYQREDYFGARIELIKDRVLIGVSMIDWPFSSTSTPAQDRAAYVRIVLDSLIHMHTTRHVHLMLVPQLYGGRHSDVTFLEGLASQLPSDASWELVDPDADSDHQQRVFGMVDAYFTSRYHPQVFAINNGVAGVCIYYQHKALGFLQQFGLERLAFPIDNLDGSAIRSAIDEVLDNKRTLRDQIVRVLPALRRSSAQSSTLAVSLFP